MKRKDSEQQRRRFGWEFYFGIFLVTIGIEIACIVFRFGFGWSSSSSTASTIGVITMGYRIHHGYLGLLIGPIGFLYAKHRANLGWTLMVLGVGLVLSDLIHHFAVLWPLTGSPQFDLKYPSTS